VVEAADAIAAGAKTLRTPDWAHLLLRLATSIERLRGFVRSKAADVN
jgi:hypothetical protein